MPHLLISLALAGTWLGLGHGLDKRRSRNVASSSCEIFERKLSMSSGLVEVAGGAGAKLAVAAVVEAASAAAGTRAELSGIGTQIFWFVVKPRILGDLLPDSRPVSNVRVIHSIKQGSKMDVVIKTKHREDFDATSDLISG